MIIESKRTLCSVVHCKNCAASFLIPDDAYLRKKGFEPGVRACAVWKNITDTDKMQIPVLVPDDGFCHYGVETGWEPIPKELAPSREEVRKWQKEHASILGAI